MTTFNISCTLEVKVPTDDISCQDAEDRNDEAYSRANVKYIKLKEQIKQLQDVGEVWLIDIERNN